MEKSCRLFDLGDKEVIDLQSGARLGYIYDAEIDLETGQIRSFFTPGRARFFGLLGREEDACIPWDNVEKIGDDIILVFNFISAYHATMIAEKTLDRYIEKISEDRNGELEITCTSAVRAFIRSGAGDPEVIDFGGRGIVNYVEKTFGAIMGDFLFAHPDAKRALIDVRDDKLTVVAQ